MTAELTSHMNCPDCSHPNPSPKSRSRFKCKGCNEWLELNKALTNLQNHYARKREDSFRKDAWKERAIARLLPIHGTREAAYSAAIQELIAKRNVGSL